MTQDFEFSAFGWLRDLSLGAQNEIAQRFPTLPVDRISREAGYYVIRRDAQNPSPGQARETLRAIQRTAHVLHDAMQGAPYPLQPIINQAAVSQNLSVDLEGLQSALLHLKFACSKAVTFISEGRRRSPRERLVCALVGIFRDAGKTIDAKPKGAFCQLVEIILQDVGEKPSDVRKLVQPVVRALENSKKKAGAFCRKTC